MDRLIVKNFGPLKDVDIELNKINLFIGENGSGKSVLGKIITILFQKIRYKTKNEKEIFEEFKNYNIDFIDNETYISYQQNNNEVFRLSNKNVFLSLDESSIQEDKDIQETLNQQKALLNILEIENKQEVYRHLLKDVFKDIAPIDDNISLTEIIDRIMDQGVKNILNFVSAQYIPAERSLISLFNKSLSSLLVADIPLPKFLLQFSSEFEKAGNELKELEFLNVKYVNGDGLDRHKVYFNDDDYLSLEHSSSGIQSALPLYLTIKYFVSKHNCIIIEEPEQNLFPKAQSETIKYIVEQVSAENNLFMMTHSPYVLSTLNNLIYAHIVANLGKKEKDEVKELIDEKQWINPNDFSAYYLENGIARNIKSDIGLIADNEIDNISEEMGEEFDELLEIYRASKND